MLERRLEMDRGRGVQLKRTLGSWSRRVEGDGLEPPSAGVIRWCWTLYVRT
ncbi:hypothetical protein CCHR01_13199 [Colletotrichum chrysophilum]|uniref:Uncharacterized protein n=1 Tax=Colletotrichum chrysophilum TaxID=1836956 RepID=A0AAD9AEN2_9PEZI|nr:hypothetical protein CCHR01_13199 [Colletotrichum chrysophilum]